jgi:2,3-bisphosphoglycerate-independent phosphoglycerate mutase
MSKWFTIENNIEETIGEVLEKHNKKQIKLPKQKEYPHVTFFSVVEKFLLGERRILKLSKITHL